MDDRTVAKLSLLIALAGIAGLWATSAMLGPVQARIADIDSSDAGKIVRVQGTLTQFGQSNGNYFLTINDGSEIRAVLFESSARHISQAAGLAKNDAIEITGQVAIYKGELEIIVQALNVLSN